MDISDIFDDTPPCSSVLRKREIHRERAIERVREREREKEREREREREREKEKVKERESARMGDCEGLPLSTDLCLHRYCCCCCSTLES